MVSCLTLWLPDDERTQETVDAYYQHYLRRMQQQINVERIEEMTGYQEESGRLREEGDFMIYAEVVSGIADRLQTPPFELFDEYADGDLWLLHDDRGLADLEREFQRLRQRMSESNDSTYLYNIDECIAIIRLAIENEYGLPCP